MEVKFNPLELATDSSLEKDPRLAAIHLDLWWWLVCRDHQIQKDRSFFWMSAEKSSQLCLELSRPEAAESFLAIVGELAAEISSAKMIFVPVWGGRADGELHWTLMLLQKHDGGSWEVDYKDSLTQLHEDCRRNAEKILTVFAVALNDHKISMPKDRSNIKMQPRGSGLCGQFVCHWADSKVRELCGEGPHSIGHPNIARMNARLAKVVSLILANKGFAAIHAAKKDKILEALKKAEVKQKAADKALQESAEFQKAVKLASGIRLVIPWATVAGCAKCRWKVEGSTCCNPDKMMAKERAVKEWEKEHGENKEGKFDVKVYASKLHEIYAEIKAKHTAVVEVSKLPAKAGGELWDRWCKQKKLLLYYCYYYFGFEGFVLKGCSRFVFPPFLICFWLKAFEIL